MYSAKVLDHLENPRNVGKLNDATASGEATNPVCGDLLRDVLAGKIALRVADSKSDHPLVFQRVGESSPQHR